MDAFQLIQRAQLVDPKFRVSKNDEVMFEAVAKESALAKIDNTYTITGLGDSDVQVELGSNGAFGLFFVYTYFIITATTVTAGTITPYINFTSDSGPNLTLLSGGLSLTALGTHSATGCFYSVSDHFHVGLRTTGFGVGSATVKFRSTVTRLF